MRFFTVGCLIILTVSSGIKADGDIVDRIKKVGTVCVTGIVCESDANREVSSNVNNEAVPVTGSVAADAVNPVEDNYKKSCATCHNAGLAGAPKLGDKEQWVTRIEKGIDVLYSSSINGLPPGMPAKGMCFSCSDDDLKALVDYMVDSAQ